jgi:sugar lactone lactonase YvrE
MPHVVHVDQITPEIAELAESPLWDPRHNELIWVDIPRGTLHRLDQVTGADRQLEFGGALTTVALGPRGGLVVAVGKRVLYLAEHGQPRLITTLASGDRANDGKTDPLGRLFVGTLTEARQPGACALYRVDATAAAWSATVVVPDVTLSNGLGWSPDGKLLYYADTPTLRVDAFAYDVMTGAVGERRVFADLSASPGRPDGLTVDAEGGVWVAVVRGGQVRRYHPNGELDQIIEVPVPWVTSVGFGGHGYADLFITTAKDPTTADQRPGAGSLYRFRPAVPGLPGCQWDDGQ